VAPLAQADRLIGTDPATASNYVVQMSSASAWVPVIDLHAPGAAAAIDAACERVGFLTIVNHDVPAPVVAAAWATARSFFDLPLDDKLEVAMPYPGYPYGYSPIAGETLAKSLGNGGAPDLKESFAIGPVVRPTHTITDPDEAFAWSQNLWPTTLPAMETAWGDYFTALSDLAARLLRLMATGLHLPEHHFDQMIDRHTSAMRALNYPPRGAAGSVADGQFGAGAHTDYGTLTILLADPKQGGLQVQGPGGEWHDVDAEPGSFVVNLGDAMARWTNDRWRSTMHRVQVPAGRRQSIAFFHNANWDAVIECLPTCLAAGERPRYEAIEAGPHLMQKFQATVNRY
jgi:isopenicillin N synthase-like dioxygenase